MRNTCKCLKDGIYDILPPLESILRQGPKYSCEECGRSDTASSEDKFGDTAREAETENAKGKSYTEPQKVQGPSKGARQAENEKSGRRWRFMLLQNLAL